MSRRVLVTGAGGFVGRHIACELSAQGYRVRATDKHIGSAPHGDRVERYAHDLATVDLDILLDGVSDIVHAAGLFDLSASRRALFDTNVGLTEHMARAAAERRMRFVHISSVTVYGRPRRQPASEDTPHRPGSAYEESKSKAERVVHRLMKERSLAATVLRPSGVYGPWGRYGLGVIAAAYALSRSEGRVAGIPAYRDGPRMTHVHVGDVASAVACVLEHPEALGRVFNVADDQPVAWGDLLHAIEEAVGIPPRKRQRLSMLRARMTAYTWRLLPESRRDRINRSLARRWDALVNHEALDPMLRPRLDRHAYDYWLSDHIYSSEALKGLGWRPRHPNAIAGIRETIAWYIENRWLPRPHPAALLDIEKISAGPLVME